MPRSDLFFIFHFFLFAFSRSTEGRSRFARLGLFVHITAGFMQPGINNRQVLEIYNASSYPLELVPGTRICQFIFMKMSGTATYQGRFSNQEKL
jgi:dCTP deaminase